MKSASTGRRKFMAGALAIGGASAVLNFNVPQSFAGPVPAPFPPLSPDKFYDSALSATSFTGEAADRLAIRRLIDAWAHCADRRLAGQQAALFAPDGVIENYQSLPQGSHQGETTNSTPSSVIRGRSEIQSAFAVLTKYERTTHFNGQNDVLIHGDQAIGESYCMAHQLSLENGKRKYEVLSIRYQDQFVRQDGRWLFHVRKLILDWTDTRFSDI